MGNSNDVYETVGELTENCQFLQLTHYKVLTKLLKKYIGKELLITIQVLKAKRSDKQNRYLWGVVIPYVKHWLNETQGVRFKSDYVYIWLRLRLLNEEPTIVVIDGTEIISMTGKRFSQMSTAEFAEAVDTIREKMLAKGIDIPEPSTSKNRHNFIHEFIEDN